MVYCFFLLQNVGACSDIHDENFQNIDGVNYSTVSSDCTFQDTFVVNGLQSFSINGVSSHLPRPTISGSGGHRLFEVKKFGTLFLNNLTLINGEVSGCGGGIYSWFGTVKLANVIFRNNIAKFIGGAVCNECGILISHDTSFFDNSAFYGAGIFSHGSREGSGFPGMKECGYHNNKVQDRLEIKGGIFRKNSGCHQPNAQECAVAIQTFRHHHGFRMTNALLDGNNIMVSYIRGGKNLLLIENSTIKNNYQRFGILVEYVPLTIQNVDIYNNTATRGAGMYVKNTGGQLVINESRFSNNSAISEYSPEGGAIYIDNGNVKIINSLFKNNKALCVSSNPMQCDSSDWGGAAAIRMNVATLIVANTMFVDHESSKGPGMIISLDVCLDKCYFINNIYINEGQPENFIAVETEDSSTSVPQNCTQSQSQCMDILLDPSLSCIDRDTKYFGVACVPTISPWIREVKVQPENACDVERGNFHQLANCQTYGSFNIIFHGDSFVDSTSHLSMKPNVKLGSKFSCKTLKYNATYLMCETEVSGIGKDHGIVLQNPANQLTNLDTRNRLGEYYCNRNTKFSNCKDAISFKAPVLNNVSPMYGDTRGNFWVTLTGENFGASDFAVKATINIKTDVFALTDIIHLSDTSIKAIMPRGSGGGNKISVKIGGQDNDQNELKYTYDSPTITKVFASETGGQVALYGDQFANVPPSDIRVSFFLVNSNVSLQNGNSINRTSYTRLTCNFALGKPAGSRLCPYKVQVEFSKLKSNVMHVCYLPKAVTAEPNVNRLNLVNNQTIELSWEIPYDIKSYQYYYKVSIFDGALPCRDIIDDTTPKEQKLVRGKNFTQIYLQGRNPKMEANTIRIATVIELPTGNIHGLSRCVEAWSIAKDCGAEKYLASSSMILADWTCKDCPFGAACPADEVEPQVLFGYWKIPSEWYNRISTNAVKDDNLYKIIPCLHPQSCLGYKNSQFSLTQSESLRVDSGVSTVPARCNKYSGGPLCRVCKNGYYLKRDNSCSNKCYEWLQIHGSILVPFGVIVAFFGIYLLAQVALKDAYLNKEKGMDTAVMKICLNHFAISSIAVTFPLAWPLAVTNLLLGLGFFSGTSTTVGGFNWSCLYNFGDFDHKHNAQMRPVHLWSLLLLCFTILIVLVWWVIWLYKYLKDGKNRKHLTVHFPASILISLFCLYPILTKAGLNLIVCKSVGPRKFLSVDFTIQCFPKTSEYTSWLYLVGIPIIIIFSIGTPLFFGFQLYFAAKKETATDINPNVKDKATDFQIQFGFLHRGFKKSAYGWEVWNTLRKGIFTFLNVYLHELGIALQVCISLGMLFIFSLFFNYYRPYKREILNDLESFALHVDFLTLFFGLCVFVSKYRRILNSNGELGEQATSVSDAVATHEFFSMLAIVSVIVMNIIFMMKVVILMRKHSAILPKVTNRMKQIFQKQFCTRCSCCCNRYNQGSSRESSRRDSNVELLLSTSVGGKNMPNDDANNYMEL